MTSHSCHSMALPCSQLSLKCNHEVSGLHLDVILQLICHLFVMGNDIMYSCASYGSLLELFNYL